MVFAPNWRAGLIERTNSTFGLSLALMLIAGSAFAHDERVVFDIPAQPLASALERYSALTGNDLLYNSNLTRGVSQTASRELWRPMSHLLRFSAIPVFRRDALRMDRSFCLQRQQNSKHARRQHPPTITDRCRQGFAERFVGTVSLGLGIIGSCCGCRSMRMAA